MIRDWLTKKFTLLIIPEANRQVRRLRLPAFWLYALPGIAGIALIAGTLLAANHAALLHSRAALAADASAAKDALSDAMAAKDAEIAKLQDEVVRLSQEAEAFAAKMAELQALEREILALSGEAGVPTAEAARANEAAVSASSANVGGEYVPVGTNDALRLSEETRDALASMNGEAERLEGALQEALKEAERIAYLRRITPSIYPTTSTQITSFFGYRKDPFTRKSAYHRGVDFGGNVGDPIYATADGTVSRTGYERAMGNYIYVNHGNGMETVYMHLSKTLVKKGKQVKKGEKIGLLGSTGRSTGPHLHYEVHKNGVAINPKPYIQHQEG